MLRKIAALSMALLWTVAFAAGCARPRAQATADPDAPQLTGLWEQFIPVDVMPRELELTQGGAALTDGNTGQWRLADGVLNLRIGGEQRAYSYTLSGYLLSLYDLDSDTSSFYINSALFAAGADGNAGLKGQWAGFSTYGKMVFDGEKKLNNIVYTTAGKSEIPQEYAARDGILQTVDKDGNYTYNLYSFSDGGALLLAESSEFDSEVRQWSSYWKKAEPDAALIASWTLALHTDPGSEGLPSALRLDEGGKGRARAEPDGESADLRWEYYNGGFVILEYGPTNLQYAWCTPQGAALYLGNPDVDEGWYIDEGRFAPTTEPLGALAGAWAAEDGAVSMQFGDGTVGFSGSATNGQTVSPAAADGLLRLTWEGNEYYMAYIVDGDTMKLYFGEQPFISGQAVPVELNRQ